jgi:predicted amino acid-binding ACT domain protein
MNILDKPSPFDGANIRIPLYHRGHLSLFPGAKVWLCLIPRRRQNQFTELIISPIHYDAWTDLWRISITLRERIGLVHEVFQILADNGLNIVTTESTTRDRMSLHSIEIIANAKLYNGSLNDLSHEERSIGQLEELSDLRTEILARLIDDIEFLPNGRPRLQIRRVRSLFNARTYYNEAQVQARSGLNSQQPIIRETIVNKVDKKVLISLPEEVKQSLIQAMNPGVNTEGQGISHYLTVSNTSERFLHIYFMEERDSIIAPTIEHQDEIGALAKISAVIQAAGFNILTTLSRLYQWETRARTEFVLQPPHRDGARLTTEQMRRRLEEALSTGELIVRYGIEIGYPSSYVTPVQTKKLTIKPTLSTDSLDLKRSRTEIRSAETVMSSKLREFTRRIQKNDATPRDFMAHQLLEVLIAMRATSSANTRRRGILFVSYSFQEAELYDRVLRLAKRNHFDVVSGKKLGRAETTREGIINLMATCTHFLGIWTPEGGTPVEDGYFPSPWLHWEWGVADALGLTWHLLISNKINDQAWKRIAGSTPHSIFSRDFDEKLKDALKLL